MLGIDKLFKWFGKQFFLGQIYNWAKERLGGLLLTIILLKKT